MRCSHVGDDTSLFARRWGVAEIGCQLYDSGYPKDFKWATEAFEAETLHEQVALRSTQVERLFEGNMGCCSRRTSYQGDHDHVSKA